MRSSPCWGAGPLPAACLSGAYACQRCVGLVCTSPTGACVVQVPAYRLKLPPKRLFNHNPTPDFVEERRQQLDSYLQMLLQDRQLQGAPA